MTFQFHLPICINGMKYRDRETAETKIDNKNKKETYKNYFTSHDACSKENF
jgi:hypothetical protein